MDRSIAPKISEHVSLSTLPVEHVILKNGIEIDFVNGGSQEILKIELIFDAGSKYQNKSLQSSLAFDLLLEGTERLSGNDFTEAIDLLGGFLSTETTKDFGTITVFVLSKYLKETIDLISEMLTKPRVVEEDFNRLLKNSKNNFLINQEKTSFLAKQALNKRLFAGSAYARVADAASFDDLKHEDVVSFVKQHIVGSGFTTLVSGMVREADVETVKTGFSSLKISNTLKKVVVEKANPKTGIYNIKKENEQCSLSIGKVMPNKNHPDTHKISFVNTILGGYFGSRLMQNIREEKGWTYGISSAVFAFEDAASLMIGGDVLKDKGAETIDEIRKEILKLQTELVSDKEMILIKNYLKGKMLKGFDGAFEQADRYFTINTFGLKWDFYENYLKTLETISAEDVKVIANKYFSFDELVVVTAG
jgi:predicted Zn-dependent peptidase